jgi:hypothetical protein
MNIRDRNNLSSSEYDFRYNNRIALGVNDQGRAARAIRGAAGKRLRFKELTKSEARLLALDFLRWRRKTRTKA